MGWGREAPKLVQTGICLGMGVCVQCGAGQREPSCASLGPGRKAPGYIHLLLSVQSQQNLLKRTWWFCIPTWAGPLCSITLNEKESKIQNGILYRVQS